MHIWTVSFIEPLEDNKESGRGWILVGHYTSRARALRAKERTIQRGFATEERIAVEKSFHREEDDHTGGLIAEEDRVTLEPCEIVEKREEEDGRVLYRTKTTPRSLAEVTDGAP